MTSPNTRPPVVLFGVPIHPWTTEETLGEIQRRLDGGLFTQHVVVNVAKIVDLQEDVALRDAVLACDIVNADGMGIVWGARLLGIRLPERVAGIDLFERLLGAAAERGHPVYLLGAEPDVVAIAAANARTRYPRLIVSGYHHGYFWDDEEAVVRSIRASGARLLFVGISSPRKEQFIARWGRELGVGFVMGVGGALDILAGKTRRAPSWMQTAGLEWVFRLLQEPSRLWRRYLVTNTRYAWLITRALLSGPTTQGTEPGRETDGTPPRG